MKNLRKYVRISLIMSIMVLAGLVSNVNATSGGLLISTGDTTPTPSPSATTSVTPTPTPSPSATTTVTPTPRPNTKTKTTNDINKKV